MNDMIRKTIKRGFKNENVEREVNTTNQIFIIKLNVDTTIQVKV
jgi:hypothetical protein